MGKLMDSPRKKIKVDDKEGVDVNSIPESPVRLSQLQVPASSPVNNSIPAIVAYDSGKVAHSGGARNLNHSIRKAGFPSQRQSIVAQDRIPTSFTAAIEPGQTSEQFLPAPPNQSSDPYGSRNVQQMRQHVHNYQYNGNTHFYGPHAGLSYGAPSTTATQISPYIVSNSPHLQSSQHFSSNDSNAPRQHYPLQVTGHTAPSIADQYSSGRPRQRLIQHAKSQTDRYGSPMHNQYSLHPNNGQYQTGQPTNIGPYNHGQANASMHLHGNVALMTDRRSIDLKAIAKLSEIFPHLPDAILRKALMQSRGNIEDAKALIADDRVSFDVSDKVPAHMRQPPMYPMSIQTAHDPNTIHFTSGFAQQHRALPVSSKREIKAPNLSIREKQALRTAQTYPGQALSQTQSQQTQYNNPYTTYDQQRTLHMQQLMARKRSYTNAQRAQIQTPVYEAPKLRTRAARKGPKIDVASDESEDDFAVEPDSEGQDGTEGETDDEDSGPGDLGFVLDFDRVALELRLLHYVNTVETASELADLASCSEEIASFIIHHRPFAELENVRLLDLTSEGKRPSRTRKTVGTKAIEMSLEALEAYEAIDSLVAKCEEFGRVIKDAVAEWGINISTNDAAKGAIEVTKVHGTADISKSAEVGFLKGQPALLPEGLQLKDYQLFGVNWLNLMYQKKLSGILADEMGLGKTCQVICFLGVLLGKGLTGPHLIVVPASTLENWLREISRFCPSLKVEAYYGSQRERNEFRDHFEGEKRDFNIMVTTYQLATGAKDDRFFLKKQPFDVCIYDEGHNLKNSASSRYKYLMAVKANFRILLTGTPLQNNLKELISLLSFVLPKVFAGNMERLDSIFKIKAFGDPGTQESALLSQQRISRAKTMMTPFILRRYKKDVLDDLPKKKYRIDYLELNESQRAIYDEQLANTRNRLEAEPDDKYSVSKDLRSAVNVMMQLRKCSNHPMLFRKRYDDKLLKRMAKGILKEEVFQDSEEKLVIEDMEVMTDFELNRLCLRYPRISEFSLEQDCWMEACKVQHLKKIIPEMKTNGDRILLFSQFTQTLDILEDCMDTMGVTYFRLDGSTDVSARQDLIDQFHEETDITVFLLSTKAGGFGINLACANVVIIYDSSFNPHDDKQAEDRAHRVGQKKEVQIIRLVTKDTIEEHIARLANTKLTLDSSISGDTDIERQIEEKAERKIAQTLMSELTAQA